MDTEAAYIIAEAVRESREPHWLTWASVIANVALALIAVTALSYAARQFGTSREQANASAEQAAAAQSQVEAARAQVAAAERAIKHAQAAMLREMDRDFEGPQFEECRVKLHKFRRKVESELNREDEYRHLPEDRKLTRIRDECSKQLYAMRENEQDEYLSILKMGGFFETIGIFVEKEHVSSDDVFEMYGGSILRVDDVLGTHIQRRQEEEGMPPGYFKNYRSLVQKTRERMLAGGG